MTTAIANLIGKSLKVASQVREMQKSSGYNVQYLPCGHSREVIWNEIALVKKCKEHKKLDAPILSSDNCPICRLFNEKFPIRINEPCQLSVPGYSVRGFRSSEDAMKFVSANNISAFSIRNSHESFVVYGGKVLMGETEKFFMAGSSIYLKEK
jgi:hypothetical protein